MPQSSVSALLEECRDQSQNCLYTSASLFIWQKHARGWRQFFVVAPIIIGAMASVFLVFQENSIALKSIASTLTVLASVFPAMFVALNLDMHVAAIARSATEFTNLRDRFNQAAKFNEDAEFDEFREVFEVLMDRMDSARENAPAVPEWCFKKAQEKINSGDYSHST